MALEEHTVLVNEGDEFGSEDFGERTVGSEKAVENISFCDYFFLQDGRTSDCLQLYFCCAGNLIHHGVAAV